MQIQNDQIKFLLDTIQKLLVTILSNQQNQYKCCCFKNNQCKKDNDYKTSELIKNVNDTQEGCQLQHSDNNIGKTQIDLEINDIVQKKNEQTISKCSNKQNIKSVTTDKPKILKVSKHNKSNNATINIKEKERTYSVARYFFDLLKQLINHFYIVNNLIFEYYYNNTIKTYSRRYINFLYRHICVNKK